MKPERTIRAEDYEASESLARETLRTAQELREFAEAMIEKQRKESEDETR